jgi:hypothetical protein
MKSASSTLLSDLANGYSLKAQPKLVAEWNLNQYYPVVTDNEPSEDTDGYDIEMFPISSIAEPNRPIKGINKARVGESKVYGGYSNPPTARFYVGSFDDKYKYWTSPSPSDASTGNLADCAPFIVYGTRDETTQVITYQTVQANKIVVTFENSWATPDQFVVEVFSGGTWSVVFSEANITDTTWERTGQLVLYWNGTNWRQNNTPSNSVLKSMSGILTSVTHLKGGVQIDGTTTKYHTGDPLTLVNTSGKDSHCNVIEISARRVADLTSDLVNVSDTFDMSDTSNLYPVGTLTSNTASIELWNGDNTYSADNTLSPYKGILEPNVKMNLSYIYTLSTGATEEIQQFVMYCGEWKSQKSDTVSLELTDYSKFFQNTIPLACMWEELTVPEIIFRLCDSVGFSNYYADYHDSLTNFYIPVFWTDGEKNMWEILDDLAKASQTAIYFDETGTLRAKTREAAFDDVISPVYSLIGKKGDKVGDTSLPNIISLDQTTAYEANTVNVSYQTTRWSDYQNGLPALQKVWEPEGDVVLRSTELVKPATSTDTMIYINAADAAYWTYTGIIQVDGEIISYDGLEYVYYTYSGSTATRNVAIVSSADDKRKYDLLTPDGLQYRNSMTGGLHVKNRGEWNSTARSHTIGRASGYTVALVKGGAKSSSAAGYFTDLPNESRLQVNTNTSYGINDFTKITMTTSSVNYNFGTKFKFVSTAGYITQRAGIVVNAANNSTEDGYYIELSPSEYFTDATRTTRNEVTIWSRKSGVFVQLGKGAVVAVAQDLDYEVDVTITDNTTSHLIRVWVNGQFVVATTAATTNLNAMSTKFGLYARGATVMKAEYLYAIKNPEPDYFNDFSFLDKKSGGFIGDAWERHWVYRWDTNISPIKTNSTQTANTLNQKFFDDFGPIVHEIREFDVKFEPKPVLHSRLYMTNDFNAALLDYTGTSSGAKFAIANVSRINAILNGEDSLTFPTSDSPINQVLTVFGRALVIDEAKNITKKHDLQVRSRGPIEVDLASPWIQSEAMATALANWILKNMAYGNEELSVEIFGNPLIEITDVVDIYYAAKNLTGHRYFVTGVSTSFQNGIQTTLTLRRVNPAATF